MAVAEINPKTGVPFPPKETGDIECAWCGHEVSKGDKSQDHMNGCPHPHSNGVHLYRHVVEKEYRHVVEKE